MGVVIMNCENVEFLSPLGSPPRIWSEFCFCFDWDFRIDDISEIFQLTPYEAMRQADTRMNPLTGIQNPGFWEYRTVSMCSFDCEDALKQLQDFIQNNKAHILEVLKHYVPCQIITRLEIECTPTGDTPAIRLEPALLEVLNEIHATMDIDVDVLMEE